MMKSLLFMSVLLISSSVSAIELTDLPSYREGKVKVKLQVNYPQSKREDSHSIEAEHKKIDSQTLVIKGVLTDSQGATSFTYTIDLKRTNNGKYRYQYVSSAGISAEGTIEVIAKNKTKSLADSGEYSISIIEQIDNETVRDSTTYYSKSGTETCRVEAEIKYLDKKVPTKPSTETE